MCDLDSSFDAFPRLSVRHDDSAVYGRLRALEPGLVSHLDGKPSGPGAEHGCLSLHCDGAPLAAGSYVVERNAVRLPPADRWGRIDLIIVPPEHRGQGAGRAVILCVLLHLLRSQGPRLYSLSSLAAHGAVARVLESLGFHGQPRDGRNFIHESLALAEGDQARLGAAWAEELAAALQRLSYRLRQSGGARP